MSAALVRRSMRVAVVPAAQAEELRQELHRRGLVDRSVKMSKRGAEVLIPLAGDLPTDMPHWVRTEDVDGLEPRPDARDPRQEVRARLARYHVPLELAPTKWERYGDVVILRLKEGAKELGSVIGTAFAEALDAQTVVEDQSGIHGLLRTPDVRILWGRGMEVEHLEGGVRYRFDVAKIMFSSGNLPERTSIASKVPDGSVVVDLFAGIGYFTLPTAVHARAARIYACEINPVAYHYLMENLRVNRTTNVVPLFGDCRKTAPRGAADVVLMGHFSALDYLDVAFECLRGSGLVIYHELCPKEQFPEAPVSHVKESARKRWYDVESVRTRILKSYAPGIVHAVVEARVQRRPRGPTVP